MSTVLQQPTTSKMTNTSSAETSFDQMSPDVLKTKCQNFLSTLIRISGDNTTNTVLNVKKLIQNLIDEVIDSEEFSIQLEKELQSNRQPMLIPFLKNSIPHVRQALIKGEMTLEGIRPPPVFESLESLGPNISSTVMSTVLHQPTTSKATNTSSAEASFGQMSPDEMKTKCQNFLSASIRISGDNTTELNVKKLIQNLIDEVIDPEEFSMQLEKKLQSNHQPMLIPFLKNSLPHVRQALISGEMTLEGIRPPPVFVSLQSLGPNISRRTGSNIHDFAKRMRELRRAEMLRQWQNSRLNSNNSKRGITMDKDIFDMSSMKRELPEVIGARSRERRKSFKKNRFLKI